MDCTDCGDCEAHDATLRWFSCRWTGGQIAECDLSSARPCARALPLSEVLQLETRAVIKALLWHVARRDLFDELLAHYAQGEREFLRVLLMEVTDEHRRGRVALRAEA